MKDRFFDEARRQLGTERSEPKLASPFGLPSTAGWEWYISQDVFDELIVELGAESAFIELPPVGTPPTSETRIIGIPVALADQPQTLVLRAVS